MSILADGKLMILVTIATASYFSMYTVVQHLVYDSQSFSICGLGCLLFGCFPVHLFSFTVILGTVWNTNLLTLPRFSPPADRLVSVYGAAAHRDWSSVYVSRKNHSLYKGKNTDRQSKEVDYVALESGTHHHHHCSTLAVGMITFDHTPRPCTAFSISELEIPESLASMSGKVNYPWLCSAGWLP